MSIEIVKIGNPLLRAKVQPVHDFEEAALQVEKLTNGLRELQGAGLAANQIGLSVNIFVAEVRPTELFPDREKSDLHVIVNAEMLEHSTEIINDWEGCFSVPGYLGTVPRYSWITIRYQDLDQKTRTQTISGYLARVFQHEIDHLHGRIYLDRMQTMLSLTTRDNYLENFHKQKTADSKTAGAS